MNDYLVPAGYGQDEYVEKRSRFIGTVWPCETEQDALGHIKEMNELHREAGHNVYAYIIRQNNIMRYSDNGEPQGTAGLPTLEVFRREGVTNVLCVVTRYFGGILLGAGGLTRAYAHTAKLALDAAGIACMRQWTTLRIPCPYNLQEQVKRKTEALGGIIEQIDYGADVVLEVAMPSETEAAYTAEIVDLTAGRVAPERTGEKHMAVRIR